MGLFSKATCSVCGGKVGALAMARTADGPLCNDCRAKCSPLAIPTLGYRSAEEVRQHLAARAANAERYKAFSPTDAVGDYIKIDRNSQTWCCPELDKANPDIFSFSELIDFEMVEDGVSITKGGLGSAVVGGALFGGVGAVVGAGLGKKQKDMVSKLSVNINLRNSLIPHIEIDLIKTETKKDGLLYKNCKVLGSRIIALLSVIADSQNAAPVAAVAASSGSAADELMKFKQLLDAGVISQEEFDAKKKQLLGL